MAKVTFSSLKLKENTETKKIMVNNIEIEVLQYLPIEKKRDLMELVMQNSNEAAYVNPIERDKFFTILLVMGYTNLKFTDKQREASDELYDLMINTNLVRDVIDAIPNEEYSALHTYIEEFETRVDAYNKSLLAVVTSVLTGLQDSASAAADIMGKIDTEDFQKMLQTAQNISQR